MNSGPMLQRKTQLQQQWEVRALKLGLRAGTRLLMMATTGPRQGRQHQILQSSQRSSLQAACLLRLPLLPGDEAACPQHSPAQAELPPQTAAKQSKGQAPDEKLDASMEQPEYTESQAALQRAQARKQKAARRKAANNKGANLQTKSSASSSSSCKADSSSQKILQEPALAAARVPALAASAQPFTQPPKTHKTLLRISSQGHTASQTAPESSHSLQQSTSRSLQSAGSSSSSAAPDAMLCGPCLPDAPSGQPAIARPAPVRLPGSCMVRAKA